MNLSIVLIKVLVFMITFNLFITMMFGIYMKALCFREKEIELGVECIHSRDIMSMEILT